MIDTSLTETIAQVGRHPGLREVLDALDSGASEVRLAGLTEPSKALVVAFLATHHSPLTAHRDHTLLFVVASNRAAETALEPLRFFFGALAPRGDPAQDVVLLPAHDVLPYQNLSPHPEISERRAVGLWRLVSGQVRIVVAPVASLRMRLRGPEFYRGLARRIERDEEVSLDELVAHLASVGYERTELVEMPGQFAVRGGILDVFSPEAVRPVRLELFGDTVESLREFDPATQRSTRPLERITLLPLTDFPRLPGLLRRAAELSGLEGEDQLSLAGSSPGWEFLAVRVEPPECSLLDLCEKPVVILDEPAALDEESRRLSERLEVAHSEAERSSEMISPEVFYLPDAEMARRLAREQRLALEQLALAGDAEHAWELPVQPTLRYHGNLPAFLGEIQDRLARGDQVIVTASNTGELERLADLFREYSVPFRLGEFGDGSTAGGRLAEEPHPTGAAATLVRAPLSDGFVLPDLGLAFYGNADLFETLPAIAKQGRRRAAAFASDFSDLSPGDFVVHVDHGIGQFEGLREIEAGGRTGEFMLLRYAEDARLYIPLERLDLVQKYRTLGDAKPKLDRLGGTAWEVRKSRVRKSVAEMAEKLLRLYAERKAAGGIAIAADTPWQGEFEDAFEFEETPDQLRAIEEVKRDMERHVAMERLLCGDVGYGKTEVAMRAAFKAVCDGKQVAVLAPTTVLVFQHYETFRRRFAAFPIRVEMLSRFRSAREQKAVLADLEAGKVDVVIGTHRLLSRDVCFHNLGLLVVDEEQRFGVAHKERIKELRRNVDVLTMSATPIPRTLHMSLAGIRDLSLIETPPKDRLAIQTVVTPFSERLVQSAVEQELARDGQVYFVHNRVESIASMATLLRRLVPHARIVVGHGQMPERELERVMLQFIRHESDLLLSTTIIENGLDIPRVNTILINRADRFGLAELYQLRGRVGRSTERAYAYLLVPKDVSLSALARRRLAALKEFSELGAGFRIAALDLELRGAGNLLGREQHGHVNSIGFDLYCQMLERAVAELKGEAPAQEMRTTLNLGIDIRIPAGYIPGEALRLRTYKRVAGVKSEEERDLLRRELEDRFGPPPAAVLHLLEYAVLKALCERLLVASVERRGRQVAIQFHLETPVKPEQLVRLLRARKGLRLDPGGALLLEWPDAAGGDPAIAGRTSAPGQLVPSAGDGAAIAGLAGVRNVLLQLQS